MVHSIYMLGCIYFFCLFLYISHNIVLDVPLCGTWRNDFSKKHILVSCFEIRLLKYVIEGKYKAG
jgi:hypothetical protein